MSDPFDMLMQMIGETSAYPPNSRYHRTPRTTLDLPDGRQVAYLKRRFPPQPGRLAPLTEHSVVEGDRLDNLATQYLGDPELYWRIADANNLLHPREGTLEAGRKLRITLPEEISE